MTILKIIEKIANNAHHRIAISDLVREQSDDIREAFMTNNCATLRDAFGDQTEVLAHRSTIVQVHTK